MDELHERVRILKACIRIEAGDFEEFPVALHGAVYPPRPHVLTRSPASDLNSGHVLAPFSLVKRDLGMRSARRPKRTDADRPVRSQPGDREETEWQPFTGSTDGTKEQIFAAISSVFAFALEATSPETYVPKIESADTTAAAVLAMAGISGTKLARTDGNRGA